MSEKNIIKILENESIDLPIINIVNIGAMYIGIPEIYQNLVEKNMCRVIGFEPVESECEKLNKISKNNEKYYPYFIGDGKERKFYFTNFTMNSSLYEPNTELIDKFNNLEKLMKITKIENVQTKRLDDIEELPEDIDYIKIDVQGGEYLIFENAPNILNKSVLIHTEAEFVPLYKNQPLFSDIDRLLRKHDFEFHKFIGLSGRPFKPLIVNNNPRQPISQMLWTDVVYVKNFMNLDKLNHDKLLKLAFILDEVYGSIDLCYIVLSEYDKKYGTSLAQNYLDK